MCHSQTRIISQNIAMFSLSRCLINISFSLIKKKIIVLSKIPVQYACRIAIKAD